MFMSTRSQRAPVPESWLKLLSIPNVRRLAVARLLTNIYFYSAVIVRFEMSRGLTFTEMFLLESALSLSIWLLDIPTGVWADRLGYRRLLIISRLLNAVSVVVMLLAHGFWFFVVGDVLFGAGVACDSGCEDALLIQSLAEAEASDESRRSASAFALLGACSSAGFFIGLVTGSLFAAQDPTIAVLATLAPATLAIGVVWGLCAVAPNDTTDTPWLKPADDVTGPLAQAWRLIRREPGLVGLSLAQSASFVCINAIFWYNQPLLGRAGVAARWFGPLTAVAVACGIIVPLLLPLARRWMSRRACFALSLLAPGCAYLALARAEWPWTVVALLALVVGGSAWREPLLRNALNERIADGSRATTLSALSFLGAVAGMGVNALVGRAGDVNLSVVGYGIGLALIALAVLAPWLMPREPAP